jgi:hypothetical protein
MAYRELSVVSIREVLRLWLMGHGYRTVAELAQVDRKTVRRYVESARALGLERGGDAAVTDGLVGAVGAAVTPGGSREPGEMRALCRSHREQLVRWRDDGCDGPKLVRLLAAASGVVVPLRTLQRFLLEECADAGSRSSRSTVRVADPPPGEVLEIDFMDLGRMAGPDGKRGGRLSALVCTPSVSRYTFVWVCRSQTTADVVAGLEAAWSFYGGVFPVVVPDNMKALVQSADATSPKLTEASREYAQSRGFVWDPTRVRHPQDKGRVERSVRYVRGDCFGGESLTDVASAQAHAERWCREVAGCRVHGTTRRQPKEHFEQEEAPRLLAAPTEPYDAPRWTDAVVGADHVVTVDHALYSVPGDERGVELRVRVDRATVRLYRGRALLKVHPRVAPGQSRIDPEDLPPGLAETALRDGDALVRKAEALGPSVGVYARRLLEGPAAWSRVRHVFRLLGLGRRYGGDLVDEACAQALALDVVDVHRIDSMLQRGLPARRQGPVAAPPPSPPRSGVLRFLRPTSTWQAARPASIGDRDADP